MEPNFLEVNLKFAKAVWEAELLSDVPRDFILSDDKIFWGTDLLKLVLELFHLCKMGFILFHVSFFLVIIIFRNNNFILIIIFFMKVSI